MKPRHIRPSALAPRRLSRSVRGDAGSVSLFLVIFFMAVMLLGGLVTDAGRAVHANARASDLAAKAARAGAQHVDPASLRSGATALDPRAAEDAAADYLIRHATRGQVNATPAGVTVTVTLPVRYTVLALLRSGATAVQTRTAIPNEGP